VDLKVPDTFFERDEFACLQERHMADQWYYARDGNKLGPCSAQQLKDLAAAGQIQPTDTIWKEGLDHGVAASRVKNLFPPAALDQPQSPPSAAAAPAASEATVVGQKAGETIPLRPPAPNRPDGSVLAEDTQQPSPASPAASAATVTAESPFVESAAKPPPKPPVKKGRAEAIRGAVIANQDGTFVSYVKKCVKCGHQDNCRHRMPIRSGSTRTTYYCPKCRKISPVEIKGCI
jgi:hypothetical protein